MNHLKTLWDNWNWLLPVCALLLSGFTWWYKTNAETPARIVECEKRLDAHDVEFDAIHNQINKIDLLIVEVKTSLVSIDKDLTIIKNYMVRQ